MYAVIDVETGGFSKEKNGLCEVGIIFLDSNFKKVETFQSTIKPYTRPDGIEPVSYKEDAMSVHGITMSELNRSPEATEVAETIERLLMEHGVTTIIAHNAVTMDKAWIEYFLERFGNGFKFKETICTLEIARKASLPIPDNRLSTLLEYFRIPIENAHRALDDAEATLSLFMKLNYKEIKSER